MGDEGSVRNQVMYMKTASPVLWKWCLAQTGGSTLHFLLQYYPGIIIVIVQICQTNLSDRWLPYTCPSQNIVLTVSSLAWSIKGCQSGSLVLTLLAFCVFCYTHHLHVCLHKPFQVSSSYLVGFLYIALTLKIWVAS